MNDDEETIENLKRRWEQASEIAFASIGQPDRAENVAYREKLAAELRRRLEQT